MAEVKVSVAWDPPPLGSAPADTTTVDPTAALALTACPHTFLWKSIFPRRSHSIPSVPSSGGWNGPRNLTTINMPVLRKCFFQFLTLGTPPALHWGRPEGTYVVSKTQMTWSMNRNLPWSPWYTNADNQSAQLSHAFQTPLVTFSFDKQRTNWVAHRSF